MSDLLELDHYLMASNVPTEIRDRYMELKGMDRSVQRCTEALETRIKRMFSDLETDGDLTYFEDQYRVIMQDYHLIMDFTDQKLKLAKYVAQLFHRHVVTELKKIEAKKRSAKLAALAKHDNSGAKRQRVNTSDHSSKRRKRRTVIAVTSVKSRRRTPLSSTLSSKAAKQFISGAASLSTPVTAAVALQLTPAASQSTHPTKQVQQTQRSAKVAASAKIPAKEFKIKQTGAAQTASRSDGQGHSNTKKQKKPSTAKTSTKVRRKVSKPVAQLFETPPPTQEETDETIYCYCKDVFHGKMIACDCKSCSIEWFHYSCVGITVAPRGKWYCPQCRTSKK